MDSIRIEFQLLNNDSPLDLTGSTVTFQGRTPIGSVQVQPCTIDDAVNGKCSLLLDELAYQIEGEHKAELRIARGTEVNVTEAFYYDSVESI